MAKWRPFWQCHIGDLQFQNMRARLEWNPGNVHEIPGSGQFPRPSGRLGKSSNGARAVVRHHGPLGSSPHEAVPGHEPLHPFGHELHLHLEVGASFGGEELAGGQPDPGNGPLRHNGVQGRGKQEDSEQQNPEGLPP